MNAELDLLSHTALKGSAVLLAALVVGWAWRRLAASRRYAVWMTAMLALAVLPFAMLSLPAWRVIPKDTPAPDWMVMEQKMESLPEDEKAKEAKPEEGAFLLLPAVSPAALPPSPEPAKLLWPWQEVLEALPKIWLGVVVLMLVRLLWSAVRLARLQKHLPEGECEELEAVARELGLKRAPRLCVGSADAVPMVWGVWSPCLLLPAGFKSWSIEKRRGVLLHELAHLRRRDPLALWLAQAVKALHWFNPLAWLTLRQMRADQERACDDTVLRHGVKPSDYAQSLLDLSRHSRVAPGLALCALTITRCAPVEARVKAVLDARCAREPLTLRWLAGVSALALLMLLPVAMLHAIEGPKLRGRILDRHGVVLAETTKEKVRDYPLGQLAAHVIGYTGKRGPDDPMPKGRSDIEKSQNDVLERGDDVQLTLDMRVQALTHRAMLEAGFRRGAAVVLDPRNGAILAMVSLPSYDLNAFIPSISPARFTELIKDQDMPLIARAFRSEYPPGASFSGLTAFACILAGKGDTVFECSGTVTYGGRAFRCWNSAGHGRLRLGQAIENHCNCYWYQMGNAAGHAQLESLAEKIGLGQAYDLPLDNVQGGYFPNKARLEKAGQASYPAGDVANMAIGQGMMLATPLQAAVLAATLANEGRIPVPVLLKQAAPPRWRADLISDDALKAHVKEVREAMRRVVDGGRGKEARSDKVSIAAMTGTVQWRISKDQNLHVMTGFAPFESPTLAFAVFYEGEPGEITSGSKRCGPVVKRLVEEALALPADGSGEASLGEKAPPAQTRIKTIEQLATLNIASSQIRSDLNQIALEMGTNVVQLQSVTTMNGKLKVSGIASGMISALAFREKMVSLCKPWQLEWFFAVPQTMSDGQRVRFEAEGLTPDAVQKEKEHKREREAIASSGPMEFIRMIFQDSWDRARSIASIPDLPEKAKLVLSFKDLPFPETERTFRTGFTAPRATAHDWLKQALTMNNVEFEEWPKSPSPFKQTYHAGGSDLLIYSSDGETVAIVIQVPFGTRSRNVEPKFQFWPETPVPPLFDKVSVLKGEITSDDASPDQARQLTLPSLKVTPPFSRGFHIQTPSFRQDDDLESLERRYRGMDRTLLAE